MQDTNNFMLILSTDFLYLSIFICLTYVAGLYSNSHGLKIHDFNSAEVGIPWFIVTFAFTSPTFSALSGMHFSYFTILPLGLLLIGSMLFIRLKGTHPEDRYYFKTFNYAFFKPGISLATMYILRDIIHLSATYIILLGIFAFALLLASEWHSERMNIIPTGVLYNLATLFLLLITLKASYVDKAVLGAPYFGVVALGIFTVLIYNTDKHAKHFTTETDFDLLSRFETLMDDKQFQYALDISEDGLWEYDFEEDTMQISRPLKEWLGAEECTIEHAADFWINKVHPQDWNKLPESWIPEDFAKLRKKIRSMSGRNVSFEIRLSDSHGAYKWIRVRLMVSNHGIKTTLSGSFKDIDNEKHANAQISQLSYYDATTRLPNISSMILHINTALKNDTPHGILSINIDNFKMVNDLMGFFTGDELLGKISRALAGRLPDYTHLYRFGGDEFVIINDKPETSVQIAKLVQRCFDDILGFNNTYMRITCSIGISAFPTEHAYDTESILKCADIALEKAKKSGKNRYALFEDSMIQELNQRRDLINALESSHMRDNFVIHYQKFHHTGDSESIYAEALLRWTWEGKSISPGQFIPIAEETGLIIPIGRMVLDQVCKDIAYMQAIGIDFYASVNVSAVQLLNPTFIHSLVQAIEAHCITPSFLTIEITETSLIHDISLVKGKLEVISNMGIRISLDDFGTGFSSLSHILSLPIDELKLDRTFIQDFDKDQKRQNVIQNIINLAHGMSIRVVAEGVENEHENALLKSYGCNVIQGYFHAMPMPLDEMIERNTGLKFHPMAFKHKEAR